MSHYVIKLVTGDNVFGKVDLEQSDKKVVALRDPLVWEEYEGPDGSVGSALVRYCAATNERIVPFATHHVISMCSMGDAFRGFYDAAVDIVNMTTEAYEEKMTDMTQRMRAMLLDHEAKVLADKTGDLVSYSVDGSDTIH